VPEAPSLLDTLLCPVSLISEASVCILASRMI
jgi:hypothetical protein